MSSIAPIIAQGIEAVEPRLMVRAGLSFETQFGQIDERRVSRVGLSLYNAVETISGEEKFGRQLSEVRETAAGKSGEIQFRAIREFKDGSSNILLSWAILGSGIMQVSLIGKGLLTDTII
jgi:hypothetical protein